MTPSVTPPTTQDDANGPTGARTLVVIGGLLSAFLLLPTLPYLWLTIGAVLVPVVWVKSGRTRRAMMASAGCSTKEEWKAFVAALPTKRQLSKGNTTPRASGHTVAAVRRGQRVAGARDLQPRRLRPTSFESPPRRELHFPRYHFLGQGFANYDVVGESFREHSVIAALGGLEPNVEKTVEDAITHLIPEPENPHGHGDAVMVWINGHHVGYLAHEDARRYRPVLEKVVAAGYLPTTTGRIWGVTRYDWEGKPKHHLYARVALNAPELLIPTNAPPVDPYSMLPWGPAIQVTKEADHLAELTEHLHGADSYAIAVLREAVRTLKNGAIREYVTVHLGGDEIGELTPAMSEKILPTIRHLSDLGFLAAAWARVKGSPLAIEVTLQAAKAHELPASWLAEIPVVVPALHRANLSLEGGTDEPGSATTPLEQQRREETWEF